jgi:hypothetical protein
MPDTLGSTSCTRPVDHTNPKRDSTGLVEVKF